MAADAATAGFFIGGSVGAAIAYVVARKMAAGKEDDAEATLSSVDLARYKNINADGAMRTALAGPAALFATIDRRETTALLQNYEDIGAAYAACRAGDTKPSLMAKALTARRLASSRLAALTRRARQERPTPASDLSEDFEACKKFLADYVYNISQEQGLHRLNVPG